MAQKNDRDRRVLPPCPQAHRSIESKIVSGGRRRDCTALPDPGAHCGHQACESQDANAGPRLAEIKAIAAAPSHQCPHQLTKFTALHWQHPFRRGHANRRKSQETRQAPQPKTRERWGTIVEEAPQAEGEDQAVVQLAHQREEGDPPTSSSTSKLPREEKRLRHPRAPDAPEEKEP